MNTFHFLTEQMQDGILGSTLLNETKVSYSWEENNYQKMDVNSIRSRVGTIIVRRDTLYAHEQRKMPIICSNENRFFYLWL